MDDESNTPDDTERQYILVNGLLLAEVFAEDEMDAQETLNAFVKAFNDSHFGSPITRIGVVYPMDQLPFDMVSQHDAPLSDAEWNEVLSIDFFDELENDLEEDPSEFGNPFFSMLDELPEGDDDNDDPHV